MKPKYYIYPNRKPKIGETVLLRFKYLIDDVSFIYENDLFESGDLWRYA